MIQHNKQYRVSQSQLTLFENTVALKSLKYLSTSEKRVFLKDVVRVDSGVLVGRRFGVFKGVAKPCTGWKPTANNTQTATLRHTCRMRSSTTGHEWWSPK